MKFRIVQTNPHLGHIAKNIHAIVDICDGQDALCLTSSFALCGQPWERIAFVGGFFERMHEPFDCPYPIMYEQIAEQIIGQKKLTWQYAGQGNAVNIDGEMLCINDIHIYAPHNLTCHDLTHLTIPQSTQLIYLPMHDRFCDGLDVKKLVCACAKKHAVPIVYVNTCGATDGIVYGGASLLVDAHGEILLQLATFHEDDACFSFDGKILEVAKKDFGKISEDIHADGLLFMAASCAIKEYAKKNGMQKALIGMSGGMDSALVAVMTCDALGAKNVLGVMMPSKYSSEHSFKDAVMLMDNLGMAYKNVPIQAVAEAFSMELDPVFAQFPPLLDEQNDLTFDNIQARVRGNILMAFANRLNCMVMGTGNKSEIAMGFCTLYGDTVGAIEPLADIYKTRVYAVARWYNREKEIIPTHVLMKAPSAELRPDQKDEDTLPPYPLLDRMLTKILEERCDPNSIDDPELTSEYKQLILSRLAKSEFKRKQCPLVVLLTSCPFVDEAWSVPTVSKAF